MENVREILDRIGVFRHPCDVDLVVFFARHPRTLMPSEQIAAFLGYEQTQVAESLDVLIEARFLERTSTPTHPARLYVFALDGPSSGWLPALLRHAATRDGRLAIRRALKITGSAARPKAGARPAPAPSFEQRTRAHAGGERIDG